MHQCNPVHTFLLDLQLGQAHPKDTGGYNPTSQLGSLTAAPPGLVCSDNHILDRALLSGSMSSCLIFLVLITALPTAGEDPIFMHPIYNSQACHSKHPDSPAPGSDPSCKYRAAAAQSVNG